VDANPAHEPLVDHQGKGGGHREGIGDEQAETFKNAAAGTGVQGREHKVAREGGAHGEVGGFLVTDFADQQDLWILAEEVADGIGEGESPGFVDFGLHHAGNDDFHGIFDGDEVASGFGGQFEEGGMTGGGFAAASRAREEDQSGGLGEGGPEGGQGGWRKPEIPKRHGRTTAEQPEDDLLAADGRVGGDADIFGQAGFAGGNAAFLRQGILKGAQAREVLQSTDHPFAERIRESGTGMQDAVDAPLVIDAACGGLEMDVAGVCGVCGGEQFLDGDRRVGIGMDGVGGRPHGECRGM
jgi:hypothetical protein